MIEPLDGEFKVSSHQFVPEIEKRLVKIFIQVTVVVEHMWMILIRAMLLDRRDIWNRLNHDEIKPTERQKDNNDQRNNH